MKYFLVFLLLGNLVWAQGAGSLPEMEPSLSRFNAALQAIADARGPVRNKIKADYAANLDTVFKQIAATGDLDAALQVKAEKERIAVGQDPTEAQKAGMPSALKAARDKYERALVPSQTDQRNAENVARQRYLAELEQLQRQLTMRTELDKAALVKAERERIAKDYTPPANDPLAAKSGDHRRAGSDHGFSNARVFRWAEVGCRRAAHTQEYAGKRDRGKPFQDLPKEGDLLVGFEITKGDWFGAPFIKSVQPIYLGLAGKSQGGLHGLSGQNAVSIEARDGYAIGAINIADGNFLWSMQITYMKIDPLHRNLDTTNTYQSDVYGDVEHHPEWKPNKKLGGDGKPIIGVFGYADTEMNSLGVIQSP